MVIDRRHEGVSGHHLSITDIDAAGAGGVVHGDNGVSIDGGPVMLLAWASFSQMGGNGGRFVVTLLAWPGVAP